MGKYANRICILVFKSGRTLGLYLLMQMHVKFDVGVRKVLPEGQERRTEWANLLD